MTIGTTKLRERTELTQAIAKTQTGDRLELAPEISHPRFAEIVDDAKLADGLVIGAALIIGTVKEEGESFTLRKGKTTQRFPKKYAKLVMLDHFGDYD